VHPLGRLAHKAGSLPQLREKMIDNACKNSQNCLRGWPSNDPLMIQYHDEEWG
jgi:hypothetical protein